MVHLISCVVCEDYQELMSGDCNYITVFDEIHESGVFNFDFVTKWYGEGEIILEKVIVLSPSNEVLCANEQELKVEGIKTTLSELEIDFKEEGIHWIFIYENDNILNKVPIMVYQGEE